DLVNVSKVREVTCITINRPDKKNCLNLETVRALKEAVINFESDSTSYVGIICGARGNFCYGYDVDDFAKDPEMIDKIEALGLFDIFCKKPLVAAINGYAVGAGFDLALWCDFLIIEETAVLGCYARQFGSPISKRSAERVVSVVGMHKALDWILTGRIVKAKEAYESGIVNRLVACGTGIGQAVNFSCALANMPQACLRADRAALYSLSNKYSEVVRGEIVSHFEKMRIIAMDEVKRGVHMTKSGDVRIRS
ncbi:hypothetical protein AAG570_002177, partial [Ranatra chinensis]